MISGAVADAYLDDQRAAKADITQRASGWLGERIEWMRGQVRDAERAVADYKSANSMVDVTQGNKLISRQIEDLTQQLALARSRTADAWARLERVEHVTKYTTDPAALAEALQSPVIANLRAQLAETARADAENNALYGDRHPSRASAFAPSSKASAGRSTTSSRASWPASEMTTRLPAIGRNRSSASSRI